MTSARWQLLIVAVIATALWFLAGPLIAAAAVLGGGMAILRGIADSELRDLDERAGFRDRDL